MRTPIAWHHDSSPTFEVQPHPEQEARQKGGDTTTIEDSMIWLMVFNKDTEDYRVGTSTPVSALTRMRARFQPHNRQEFALTNHAKTALVSMTGRRAGVRGECFE